MKITINFKYLRDVFCQLGIHNWQKEEAFPGAQPERVCLVCGKWEIVK